MLKGILNIIICPQDDRFETLSVTDNFRDGYFDISINTLLNESFRDIITDENNIQSVIETMKFNLQYEEFEESFPFYRYVLEHCREKDFFSNFERVFINGVYEDIVIYLKRNPELLDKEIILAESLDLDKNTCDRIREVFREFPNIKLMIYGNSELITLDEYDKAINAIDSIVDKILMYDYSPLEQLILAYDLIRDRFYVMEDDDEDLSKSRDLTSTLLGEKIVCAGFANIFNAVCKKLNIKSMTFLLNKKDDAYIGHARNMVYLEDEKYGIYGLYFFDSTFDCKKDEENNFLYSYRFFAKDYIEMDKLSNSLYYPKDFKIFESEHFANLIERSKNLPNNLTLAFRLLADYKMSTLLKFINRDTLDPLELINESERIVDAAYDIKSMAENPIGTETFLKALYIVRKNQYYQNPSKYMFDIDALTKIINNSRFRADDSAKLSLLSMMGFNYYYGKQAGEDKVKRFISKNNLDVDIERTKLARTLRTILQSKLDEENKGRKL